MERTITGRIAFIVISVERLGYSWALSSFGWSSGILMLRLSRPGSDSSALISMRPLDLTKYKFRFFALYKMKYQKTRKSPKPVHYFKKAYLNSISSEHCGFCLFLIWGGFLNLTTALFPKFRLRNPSCLLLLPLYIEQEYKIIGKWASLQNQKGLEASSSLPLGRIS